jgi:hypothetical protein
MLMLLLRRLDDVDADKMRMLLMRFDSAADVMLLRPF